MRSPKDVPPCRRPGLLRLALAPLLATPLLARELPAEPPRLVVLICCERLSPEHLRRLGSAFDGGLARLAEAGSLHLDAVSSAAWSDDAPAFASLATGTRPARHGVVGDAFRPEPGSEMAPATRVEGLALLASGPPFTGPEPGGASPARMRGDDLGARLRAADPAARVLAVGGDVDGAVLLGGAAADWALWWDRRAGGFTSSDHYGAALPDWVMEWNRGWVARAAGWSFEPQLDDPGARGFGPDGRPGETPSSTAGALLPLTLPDPGPDPAPMARRRLANVALATPLVDRLTVDLALAGVEALELGADGACDLLALDLSGLGQAVRRTGPYSLEAAETVLAVDRLLGELFDALDARLPDGAWVAAVTGSVGCLELPEALAARGVGVRRLFANETRRDLARVREALESSCGTYLGATMGAREIDLDDAQLEGVDAAAARRVARDAALASADWLAAAYTREELVEPLEGSPDPWLELYRSSFPPDRAPDVALRAAPWVLYGMTVGTGSGSPYPWDRRTVIGFLGPGFTARQSWAPAALEDVLPTLLERLGLDVGDSLLDGRALR